MTARTDAIDSRMSRARTATRSAAAALCASAVLMVVTTPGTAGAQSDAERAGELTRRAVDLIDENRLAEALDLLEQAVQADPEGWEAYYQQGRIFGMREDFLMARHMLLQASELNPGHAHTHRLAWEAAYRIGDFENAWDQAIRASLAGIDMNQRFLEMYGRSDPPEDFEQRINAPRIYVAELEIADVAASNQLPFNRNPATGGVGTISGRPAYAEGLHRANENAFNLRRVRRQIREAIFRARYLGAVLELEMADYVLGISVDSIGEAEPVGMEGYLRLYDASNGEVVYFRSLALRDISSEARLFGEMERHITNLQEWILERNR